VSRQVAALETLFLHEEGPDYVVAGHRDGEGLFQGRLELKETEAGPRPARLRVVDGSDEELLGPDRFVELARRADRIRISEQTSRRGRAELQEMLSGYQLESTAVRTCRLCATEGRYSPITADNAIDTEGGQVCPDCARAQLDRELAYRGELSGAAAERLAALLLEVQDLQRISNLLEGRLDPELTKVDEISATVDEVDPIAVADLDLHPALEATVLDRFDQLLPVQSLAVQAGALDGQDQLVVSATATGKTLVGELAGIDRALRGGGTFLFLVPLVALANQKYGEFQDRYGHLADVTLRVGSSRIGGGGRRFDPSADVIVGTYEGMDHALRVGRDLGDVGTVAIDEIHTVGEGERGHRLDGLITRLRHYTEARGRDAQWLYLSATVGNPESLAAALDADLVEFEERPVPIERHLTFVDGREKARVADKLVTRAFDSKSGKGYRGQTIVFTNSRRRCHELSRRLEYDAAPYHAGLDNARRKRVEQRFAEQDLAAVVTTAALAAGVDFPASQVVFDSLAMGIEWLSIQEFEQMAGRAGRPDYHDQGTVYLLVEPDGSYHYGQDRTEDEVAFTLLEGEPEPVVMTDDEEAAIEETLANVTVGGKAAKRLNERMVGDVPTKYALGKLLEYEFIDGLEPTPLGRAVTRHFLSPSDAFDLLDGIRKDESPPELVARLELQDGDE
jgi:helicase